MKPQMKTRKTKAPKRLTLTQIRSKIVSVLKQLGYTLSSQLVEHGRAKAWLKPPQHIKAIAGLSRAASWDVVSKEAVRIGKAIMVAGLPGEGQGHGYGAEWNVIGPQYRVTVNQEDDSGNPGGAFVEVFKRGADVLGDC